MPGEEFKLGDEVCSQGGSVWTAFVPHLGEVLISRSPTDAGTSGLEFLRATETRESSLRAGRPFRRAAPDSVKPTPLGPGIEGG